MDSEERTEQEEESHRELPEIREPRAKEGGSWDDGILGVLSDYKNCFLGGQKTRFLADDA